MEPDMSTLLINSGPLTARTAPLAGNVSAAAATRRAAASLKDRTKRDPITPSNLLGVSAYTPAYGATAPSVIAPERSGKPADVVPGYDDLSSYVDPPDCFRVTVGHWENRVVRGRFELDGHAYKFPLKDKTNSFHGSDNGLDEALWKVVAEKDGPIARVVLRHRSPNGGPGYPGNLDATVTCGLDGKGGRGTTFEANTNTPSIVNMTNVGVLPLAGERSPQRALDQRLTILANAITPVNPTLIPTGNLRPVAGTVAALDPPLSPTHPTKPVLFRAR